MTRSGSSFRASRFSEKRRGHCRRSLFIVVATVLALGAIPAAGVLADAPGARTPALTTATGTLKICKVAGVGVTVGTSVSFTVTAPSVSTASLSVPAGPAPGGYCKILPSKYVVGTIAHITEHIPSGDHISSITANAATPFLKDYTLGTSSGTIVTGVTEFIYTNTRIPVGQKTGYLEICKAAATGQSFTGQLFTFAVQGRTVTVPTGACSPAINLVAGSAIVVTEAPTAGFQMSACKTLRIADLVTPCDLTAGKATVKIAAGAVSTETILTVTNERSLVNWKLGAQVPTPHIEGTEVAAGDSIYDISGSASDCSDGDASAPIGNVDIYHPDTNSFTVGDAIPNPREEGPVSVVVGTKIYVIGGTSSCSGEAVAPVDVYDTSTGHWEDPLPASADLPAVFQGDNNFRAQFLTGAAIGNTIYFFGWDNIGMFNTQDNTWTVVAAPGSPQIESYSRAFTVGNTIRIATGYWNNDDDTAKRVLDYDPTAQVPLTQEPLSTIGWAEEAGVLLKGNVVLVSGDFNGKDKVQVITPTAVLDGGSSPIRDDVDGGGVVNDTLYIVGGQSADGGTTPNVLIGTPNW